MGDTRGVELELLNGKNNQHADEIKHCYDPEACDRPPTQNTGLLARESSESTSTSSGTSKHSADVRIEVGDAERGMWGSKLEFFFAIMGYTVGIGSVWRFPIICRYAARAVLMQLPSTHPIVLTAP